MNTKLANHYQIVKHLGGGGFGQTFLAKDIHLPGHPLCVVKKLQPTVKDAATLEIAKRLFNQEAETLYRLGNHDQIPRLMANFEENSEFYLVQEYIEGKPLDQELILGKQMGETYTIVFLKSILQVLAFVHQERVIHRDIKPANLIRRSKDNQIVLIDFGAVKEVSNQATKITGEETSLTVAVGSPGYMPREQQTFRPHLSSDVYAVGIVCLQALTGLPPKKLPQDKNGEYQFALFKNISPVNPKLAEILEKMVRYDYQQRYKTAIEALQAVEELISYQSSLLSHIPTTPINSAPPTGVSQVTTEKVVNPQQISLIDPSFIELCRRELALIIGPFANFIIEDTLAQYPQITSQQLVEILTAEIPNSQQAKEFKQLLLL